MLQRVFKFIAIISQKSKFLKVLEQKFGCYSSLRIFSPGTGLIERLWSNRERRKRRNLAHLVILAVSFEVEGRMIAQNDALVEPDQPDHRKKFRPNLTSLI